MKPRHAYLATFALPFILIYVFLSILFHGQPGINVLKVIVGGFLGGSSVVIRWVARNGLRRPPVPEKRSVALILLVGLVLGAAAMPLPAGSVPDRPSRADRTCDCLGTAVTAEATPRMMDIDIRKYCYGIPHSCKPVSQTG